MMENEIFVELIKNKKIQLTLNVNCILNKDIIIETDKYDVYFDEEGNTYADFSNYDYSEEIKDFIKNNYKELNITYKIKE